MSIVMEANPTTEMFSNSSLEDARVHAAGAKGNVQALRVAVTEV